MLDLASSVLLAAITGLVAAAATSITDIQGTSFQSPLNGQSVTGVTGAVTAKVRRDPFDY